jgi:hypothetical protein
MTSWEYLTVEFARREKKGMGMPIPVGDFLPRWINEQEQSNWEEGPAFLQYLADLGAQGWELAGNGPAHHGGTCLIFKRPKG